MKKLILFTITAFIVLNACNNASGKKIKETSETKEKTETTENSAVINLTKAKFLELVMDYEKNPQEWVFRGDKPCIIDFYADWCRPCKIAAPILEELANEYKGKINVYKVNTQTEQELAGVFGISSIPAFLFCPKKGKPQMSNGIGQTNEQTKAMFKKIIDEFLLEKK